MAETVYDRCISLFANKEVKFTPYKSYGNVFTALQDGTQFWVKKAKSGIAITMNKPGVRDMTNYIAKGLSPEKPGEFNTPELKKFQRSTPIAKPGLYRWNNTLIRIYHDILMYSYSYVQQKTKKPQWLSGEIINPLDWWAKKPQLIRKLPDAYWGKHPEGEGYDVIVLQLSDKWDCYLHIGGKQKRPLSDDEITQLVGDKVFEPINIKDV